MLIAAVIYLLGAVATYVVLWMGTSGDVDTQSIEVLVSLVAAVLWPLFLLATAAIWLLGWRF